MFDSLVNFVRNEHQIGQCKTLTAFNPRSSVCSPHFTLTEHQTLFTLGELSPSPIWIKRILRRSSSTLSWSVRNSCRSFRSRVTADQKNHGFIKKPGWRHFLPTKPLDEKRIGSVVGVCILVRVVVDFEFTMILSRNLSASCLLLTVCLIHFCLLHVSVGESPTEGEWQLK